MPEALRKIAFVIERFVLQSPAQQLLDRFVMGFPDNGEFRKLHGCEIAAHVVENEQDPEFQRRTSALQATASLEECIKAADAVVVVPRDVRGNAQLLRAVLERIPERARCFVYGAVADSAATARHLVQLAEARRCIVAAGTATAVAWRLPDVTLPRGAGLRRALVVVQGAYPAAEIEGLQALLPVAEEAEQHPIDSVEVYRGPRALAALEDEFGPLLASALSRSDSPQGDALTDARTQDIFGLGLVPKLAKAPRCWRLRLSSPSHRQPAFPAMLAVLDGVVADYNLAVETATGKICSWQVYRPPGPFEHTYSRLAGSLESFFRSGDPPWPADRALITAGALELFEKHAP